MGFLDKAKAAANDLAAKADTALGSSGLGGPKASGGDADKYFRDLGVLSYLEANGRPADPEERRRVMTTLQDLDNRGVIPSFALHTSPPPPPGSAAAGSQGGFPPPPGGTGTQQQPPPAAPAAPPPPPPPPSWMTKDGDDRA